MPRVTKEQMKKDEEKVVKILSTKANESIDSIAKQCGFSRQKAWRIIKNLENNKTIWGYHAVADNEKLGQAAFLLLMKATNLPKQDTVQKIISHEVGDLARKTGVVIDCSSYIHGSYDWFVFFTADSIKEAKKFEQSLCKAYSDYLLETCLLQEMFPLKRCGFFNPDLEHIREYFD